MSASSLPLAWGGADPVPGPEEVVVDIVATALNRADIIQRMGGYPDPRGRVPEIPGLEFAGVVSAVGSEVTRYKVGDRVGVGCNVGSCGECATCLRGEESYCLVRNSPTYNGYEQDGVTPTYGGYASYVVTNEHFVFRMPDSLGLDVAAPLLCAGITLYPGDVIATGTPVGVGIGFNPPKYLKSGDVVKVEIHGIGAIENPVM